MKWIKMIVSEGFGLFVDDGSFATWIILWLAVIWLSCFYGLRQVGWGGAVLFAGLGLILIGGAVRRARQ